MTTPELPPLIVDRRSRMPPYDAIYYDADSVEARERILQARIAELEQQVEDLGYEVIEAGERYRCDCGV